MTWTVRRLGPQGAAAYRALRLEALRNHPEAFASSAEEFEQQSQAQIRQLLEGMAVYAGILPDGTLAGLTAFLAGNRAKELHRGWILQVYVRPAQRGTGLGQALIERAIAEAPEAISQVHLGVWSENNAAIRLYQRLGFAIYGTEPRYLFVNGRYVDEHLMVRFLDKAPGVTK